MGTPSQADASYWRGERRVSASGLSLGFPCSSLVVLCLPGVGPSSDLHQSSNSMAPTFRVGSFFCCIARRLRLQPVLLRQFELPIDGRLAGADAASAATSSCFAFRATARHTFLKRVVGLPGDRIQMVKGRLLINDELVQVEPATARSRPFRRERRSCRPTSRRSRTARLQHHPARWRLEAVRQHARLRRAPRPSLRTGRQPQQLHRQPRALAALRRGLRAGRARVGRVVFLF